MVATEITVLQRPSLQTAKSGPRFKAAETVTKWKAGTKSWTSGANAQQYTGSQGMFTAAMGEGAALPSLRRNESDPLQPLQDEIKQATPGSQCLRDVAQSEEMHAVKARDRAGSAVPPSQSQSAVDCRAAPRTPPTNMFVYLDDDGWFEANDLASCDAISPLRAALRERLRGEARERECLNKETLSLPGMDFFEPTASREPSGRLATVGLMLWPGPEGELMVTDKKAGTSAAASALLPGDGRSLDPGAPVQCLTVMLTACYFMLT
jgi:hypothetical protein